MGDGCANGDRNDPAAAPATQEVDGVEKRSNAPVALERLLRVLNDATDANEAAAPADTNPPEPGKLPVAAEAGTEVESAHDEAAAPIAAERPMAGSSGDRQGSRPTPGSRRFMPARLPPAVPPPEPPGDNGEAAVSATRASTAVHPNNPSAPPAQLDRDGGLGAP
jgi:hypothetical protein